MQMREVSATETGSLLASREKTMEAQLELVTDGPAAELQVKSDHKQTSQ